ncbi:MAG: hypothetical protein AAFY19_04615, partial [Pseudomonadota bacterium]
RLSRNTAPLKPISSSFVSSCTARNTNRDTIVACLNARASWRSSSDLYLPLIVFEQIAQHQTVHLPDSTWFDDDTVKRGTFPCVF